MSPSPTQIRALEIAKAAAALSGSARAAWVSKACAGDAALRAAVDAILASHESHTIVPGAGQRGEGIGAIAPELAATVTPQDASTGAPPRIGQADAATIPPDAAATRPAVHSARIDLDAALPQRGDEDRGGARESGVRNRGARAGGGEGSPGEMRIGAYTIRRVLGEGGMGVVYLAEQERPRRTVALKVIRPGYLSPRLLRRFEHESQILGRLQHPGIAQVYEAGQYDHGGGAAPFFAMEFVEGESLTAFCSKQDLSIRARIELFGLICDAVQHAHVKGVVHRDLKPGNILVDASGQPKILDFGVARATDADVAGGATMQTAAGQVVGTVPYMSPEQIAGNPDDVDARSDVYTLGVILYELLAGRLPHNVEGKTLVEAAQTIGVMDPVPLGSIDRSLRGDIQTIVGKAMEKDKGRRYQSAGELAADLARFLVDEPILARPPSTIYQLRKFTKRNTGVVIGAAAALLALVGGIVATTYQAIEATRGRALAETRRQEAETARTLAREEADNAKAMSEFLGNMLASIDPEAALGREVTVREVLDQAERDIGAALADRPRIQASLRLTIGRTYQSLGRLEEAEASARAALELRRASAAATVGGEPAREVAESVSKESSTQGGLPIESGPGPASAEVIEAMRALANVLGDRGKLEEAGDLARAAYEMTRSLHGPAHVETGVALGDVARVLLETGKLDDGEKTFREAIAIVDAAVGATDERANTLRHNMAIAIKDRGRFAEAIEIMEPVLAARRATLGAEHPSTLSSLNSLAALVQKAGDNPRAAALLREALEARRRVLGPQHFGTLTSAINLGVTLATIGTPEARTEAEALFRQAMTGLEKSLGEEHSKTQIAINSLAYVLEDQGRDDEAEPLYRRCVEIRKRTKGGRDQETWGPMNNLASLLQRRGRLDEADALYRELLDGCRAALPEGHYYTAIFENNRGECLTLMKRFDEAEALLKASLVALEKALGEKHPRVVKAKARLEALAKARGG